MSISLETKEGKRTKKERTVESYSERSEEGKKTKWQIKYERESVNMRMAVERKGRR